MQPVSSAICPLLNNIVESGDVVHTWSVNDSTVRLIRNQNSLECETITNGITYTAPITIPSSDSIDQMISYLKVCKIIVDENGIPSFLSSYQIWNIENKSVHLLRGVEDLIWNIFCTATNKSEYFNLKQSTIPSIRCHPETIALIEEIKEDSLNRSHINLLKNDFKVIRILDKKTIEKERECLEIDKHLVHLDRYINNPYLDRMGSFRPQNKLITSGAAASGAGAIYLASNTICATAGAVSSFFGGGVLGTIAGGCAGYMTGGFALAAGGIPLGVALAGYHFLRKRPDLEQKEKILEIRSQILSPEKPLFVEIEPISVPSQINKEIHVSKFIWAVTLINIENIMSYMDSAHSEIIIEGINDGFYDDASLRIGIAKPVAIGEKFIHLAHYQPRIESGLLAPESLEFKTQTETWKRSPQKIQIMLQAIQREMSLPKGKRHKYNRAGIDSVLYKIPLIKEFTGEKHGHNCLTWAREKLQMIDIDLGQSAIGAIATFPPNFTKNPEEYKEISIREDLI